MLLKIIMPLAVILIIVAVIIVTKTSSLAEYHVADINRKKERKLNDL